MRSRVGYITPTPFILVHAINCINDTNNTAITFLSIKHGFGNVPMSKSLIHPQFKYTDCAMKSLYNKLIILMPTKPESYASPARVILNHIRLN